MNRPTIVLGKKVVSRTEAVMGYVKKNGHKDAVIGISAFFGVCAWIIKLLRIRQRFIYYCIDYYIPEIAWGWPDSIFIWLHIKVDKFLTERADECWDISSCINEGRYRYGLYQANSIVVPLGYPPSYFRNVSANLLLRTHLIYVGLNPYGVDLITEVVSERRNELRLILLINRRLPLNDLLDRVSWANIGLALWEKEGNQTYGDPGKTKLYLICGIPVIVTKNANFSEVIEREQAGISINYNKEELKEAVNKIVGNYALYKKNAIRVGHKYCDSEKILGGIGCMK